MADHKGDSDIFQNPLNPRVKQYHCYRGISHYLFYYTTNIMVTLSKVGLFANFI